MKVPLADLRTQYLKIRPEIDTAIQSILDSSQFILGKAVQDFEKNFATAHGAKHCIGVGSGTDALHVALWALGVKRGDAVVTVPFTFIATLEAISLLGATPVLVDIDPRTYAMDPRMLEQCLSSRPAGSVKAIVPVHLYGHPADMDAIGAIARNFSVPIVEDACQSHLATWKGTCVGNFGAAAALSFYPGKNLGAYGEAGAVITNDDYLAQKIRQLRDHGQSEKYRHAFEGHNYRMDGFQGAVLGVKLRYLRKWTDRRKAIAARYTRDLTGVGDLSLPYVDPNVEHVFHLYVLRTKRRNELQQYLASRDIATSVAYPIPLHLQEAYLHLGYGKGAFPVSEQAADEVLSLPMHAELNDAQIDHVVESVKSFFA